MRAWRPSPRKVRTSDLAGRSRYERRLEGLTFGMIAAQDGVTERAVQVSIEAYTARLGLAPPIPATVSGAELARILGLSSDQVWRLKKAGILQTEPHAKKGRYSVEAARRAVAAATAAKDAKATERTCCRCKRTLPLDRFLIVTSRTKQRGRVYSYTRPSSDCRECRAIQKRQERRRNGAPSRQDYNAKRAAEKEARDLDRKREIEARAAARAARPRLTREQQLRRTVDRQRERYNTDPEYRAKIVAKKIRRKRAMKGTQVEPINLELVAQRDGWRCAICGGKVTRENWSQDHIVPLSKGGSHTYDNITLAHRLCNTRRGIGKLAVQAPLFAHPSAVVLRAVGVPPPGPSGPS
jgi:5-methylcytosine-specific restriction endonuclease McrA